MSVIGMMSVNDTLQLLKAYLEVPKEYTDTRYKLLKEAQGALADAVSEERDSLASIAGPKGEVDAGS